MEAAYWFAIGLGAVYAAASLIAGLYFLTEHSRGCKLIILSLSWLPIVALAMVAMAVGCVRGAGPVRWRAGPVAGNMWLGPTIRRFGICVVTMDLKERNREENTDERV
jgi:hypothetical protein